MRVPVWLTLGVAALVIIFGAYRIRLALKKPASGESEQRSIWGGGMYRMSPRMHLLVGIVYLLLGAALVAASFGWKPM